MADTRALRARECIIREGSSPSLGTIGSRIIRSVAQLVARRVWDAEAAGSNPVTPTKKGFKSGYGSMAE